MWVHPRRGDHPIDGEQRQSDGAEGHQADFHLPPREAFAEQRTHTHAHGEHGDGEGDQGLIAMQNVVAVQRQLHQHQRAEEPEPGHSQNGQKNRARLARRTKIVQRRGPWIPIQALAGCYGLRLWNGETAGESQQCNEKQAGGNPRRVAMAGQQTRGQGAQQDGEECSGFQQGVAAHQFLGVQHLGQQPVLCRRKKGRVHAHHEKCKQQQGDTVLQESNGGHQHDEDFQRLDALENAGLVEALAQLARNP